MRQIGTLSDERQAQRLVDYLVTLEIAAHSEQDGDGWVLWVRDEEHVPRARDELVNFRAAPEDPRYAQASAKASEIRREREERRKGAGKNIIEMRGQWGRGMARRAPATFLLIAASVLVGLLTNFDFSQVQNKYVRMLLLRDPATFVLTPGAADPFVSIRQGELWRLFSPMLLHQGPMHLVFNMYWLWYLGGQIEDRRGTIRFLLLVLLAELVSGVAEALVSGPWFGGMSGVNYALFGYVWMKAKYDPQAGLTISQLQTILFLVWFFACFFMEGIANGGHAGGLFVGVVLAYLPELVPSLRKVL